MDESVCVQTTWQLSSPHQQNVPTLPAPRPPAASEPSATHVSQVICQHGSWHVIVTLRVFFFFLPLLCYSAFYLLFFFFSWNKETNTEKLFGIFSCIKTSFYLLFKELCDFSS